MRRSLRSSVVTRYSPGAASRTQTLPGQRYPVEAMSQMLFTWIHFHDLLRAVLKQQIK